MLPETIAHRAAISDTVLKDVTSDPNLPLNCFADHPEALNICSQAFQDLKGQTEYA